MIPYRTAIFAAMAILIPAAAADPAELPEAARNNDICHLLCGGTWEPVTPPAPDQFVTTYTYQWDDKLRGVRGVAATTGGVAGVHQELLIVYSYDTETKKYYVTRVDGDGPPVVGTVEVKGGYGLSETVSPASDFGSQMHGSYVFNGPDEFIVRQEIVTDGQVVMGAAQTYRRERK